MAAGFRYHGEQGREQCPVRPVQLAASCYWHKEFNAQVYKIRWIIEQVISHFKNWRIMNTGYRRPIDTFASTISAVIGLHFYRMA
jgi:hypothetical protein